MVVEVGAFEAKTHLSRLLERVQQGDRVVITLRGVPVAVLVSPDEIDRAHLGDVIEKLRELRERTLKSKGSIRALRSKGRCR